MGHYDAFAEEYDQIVNRQAQVIECAYRYVLEHLGDVLSKQVCDLGCGQGELSRRISQLKADVTGVDYSGELLEFARAHEPTIEVQWVHDDAQVLNSLADGMFDTVISNLMLMDVPDYKNVFRSAFRVLKPNGRMIWTITHPCFLSPHSEPAPDADGVIRYRIVKTYRETWWKSVGHGTIRSTLGAYHRPLSSYINAFLMAGFHLNEMSEPTVEMDLVSSPNEITHTEIPPILGVIGSKVL